MDFTPVNPINPAAPAAPVAFVGTDGQHNDAGSENDHHLSSSYHFQGERQRNTFSEIESLQLPAFEPVGVKFPQAISSPEPSEALPSQGSFGFMPPAAPPAIDTVAQAGEQCNRGGTAYPDILSCPSTLAVWVLDETASPLYMHTSIYHMCNFHMPIKDGKITLPTHSLAAASLLIRYFYNNAKLDHHDMGDVPAGITAELYILACRLGLNLLAEGALAMLELKLKGADIPDLCDYARVKIRLDSEKSHENWAAVLPDPIEVWMREGKRCDPSMSSKTNAC